MAPKCRKRPSARTTRAKASESLGTTSSCAVSVKVSELRSAGYANLKEWLRDTSNIYVGRRGRIFIHTDGEKQIFHYAASKWQNPFAVNESTSREEACHRYRVALLDGSLKDPSDGVPLRSKLKELEGRRLGCWCKPQACHADILAQLVEVGRT
eukprot:TRINITY_DN95000_c0_g1_i1.p1 TRINITY_DN95000_c0_g1~~TRINITY_DN95000_c0_g1_i1.p1  ORF type:complete len:154 (+),score=15.46 TRINITY_DN95000_c0_g1_i1:41-502(+)